MITLFMIPRVINNVTSPLKAALFNKTSLALYGSVVFHCLDHASVNVIGTFVRRSFEP